MLVTKSCENRLRHLCIQYCVVKPLISNGYHTKRLYAMMILQCRLHGHLQWNLHFGLLFTRSVNLNIVPQFICKMKYKYRPLCFQSTSMVMYPGKQQMLGPLITHVWDLARILALGLCSAHRQLLWNLPAHGRFLSASVSASFFITLSKLRFLKINL